MNLSDPDNKDKLEFITGMLKRRGLYLDKKDSWEVHGPQQDMKYQVYIGPAYKKKTREWLLIAIHPRSVYWIENYPDWRNCKPENRITIEEGLL